MGPLSRVIAHCVLYSADAWCVRNALDDILAFTQTLHAQWRQTKLSIIEPLKEKEWLTTDTLEKTLPVLWKVLRSAMFAVVIFLRAVMARVLEDPALAMPHGLPNPANLCHHSLN